MGEGIHMKWDRGKYGNGNDECQGPCSMEEG